MNIFSVRGKCEEIKHCSFTETNKLIPKDLKDKLHSAPDVCCDFMLQDSRPQPKLNMLMSAARGGA